MRAANNFIVCSIQRLWPSLWIVYAFKYGVKPRVEMD
jgi:hypothetical protein